MITFDIDEEENVNKITADDLINNIEEEMKDIEDNSVNDLINIIEKFDEDFELSEIILIGKHEGIERISINTNERRV